MQRKERTRQKGEREMEVVREEASSGGRVTLTERAEERQVKTNRRELQIEK